MIDEVNKKVLLAEDNLVNQKVASLLLQQLGLTVDVAENGGKAVQLAEHNSYAVILMDCQMPEMDGFEATKAIRRLEALTGAYTPIIAVTALAMVGDRERCIAVGMDDYISKPIDRQVLKIKLNHWTQREFIMRNQELSRKYSLVPDALAGSEEPINLSELEEFYVNDVEDVLAAFIQSTESLLGDINVAVRERKDVSLSHLAHELKGSSAAVGAKQMAKLALYLERAAGIKDWTEARDTYLALVNTFDGVQRFLRENSTALVQQPTFLITGD